MPGMRAPLNALRARTCRAMRAARLRRATMAAPPPRRSATLGRVMSCQRRRQVRRHAAPGQRAHAHVMVLGSRAAASATHAQNEGE